MRNQLVAALLAAITVFAVRAQAAGSSSGQTNALWDNPVAAEPVASFGSRSSLGQGGPGLNDPGFFGLKAVVVESLGPGLKHWLPRVPMAPAGVAWSFVAVESSRIHADALFPKFDLFRADTGDLPIYIGLGGPLRSVDYGDNRAGIRAPLGISYLWGLQRFESFAEVAPFLGVAPTTTLGWSGAVGIRFYFRH